MKSIDSMKITKITEGKKSSLLRYQQVPNNISASCCLQISGDFKVQPSEHQQMISNELVDKVLVVSTIQLVLTIILPLLHLNGQV